MATSISNGESGLSVRTKLNDIWHSLDLNEYNKEILDTAVDVFVYDTSKDSDGGAWRKRTQGTSWYNETLNTSTRGSRKEFPAVAVIVGTADDLFIYDGDDPDLPLWMKFADGTGNLYWMGTGGVSALSMKNGQLISGNDGGTRECNFITEFMMQRRSSSSQTKIYYGDIAGRNGSVSRITAPTNTSQLIVNDTVNDVAMTVLPNAPIDPATGLPVPTIAVATDSGVSVVTDSGAVYDSAYTAGVAVIAFDGGNGLWYNRNTSYHALSYASLQDWTSGDGFGDVVASTNIDSSSFNLLTRGISHGFGVYGSTLFSGAISATGTHLKKLHLHDINYEDQSEGLDAAISTEFNTGWMNGDIKLATLSDTDDTDVTGSELVTNGTFDSDTSGWTAGNGATLDVVSNELRVTSNGTASPYAYQNITTEVGKTYVISCTARRGTTPRPVRVDISGIGDAGQTTSTTNVGISQTFVATSTTHVAEVYISGASASGETAFFDNISVRLAEEDRSVNRNGLQVHGTIAKNPVATGADLVSYSSNSTTKYLLQPYNSDLLFGTGDFCFMFWDDGTSGSYRGLVSFGDRGVSTNDGYGIRCGPNGYTYQFYKNANAQIAATGSDGAWNHVVFLRRSGVLYSYLNGKLQDSDTFIADLDTLTNPEMSVLYGDVVKSSAIGLGVWNGNAALLRISATAPSPEQIAKIYEDEKVLFQDNAQATLYGSSDAVTALAYDDTTKLLHVGTSAGRSVFQGLRRVDNTTDAVGAAISASNGLVAED